MSKQLPKKVRMANLIAIAAEEAAHEQEHRSRFNVIIESIRVRLSGMVDPSEMTGSGLDTDFSEAVDIAKRLLRMRKDEFVSAVAVLNTAISRVVDMCPSGKDVRDVPEWMRMTAEELRMSYSLMTPYAAADFIAHHGAKVGYSASDIAIARKELLPLEAARLAKRHAGDLERQVAESARIAARASAGYTATLYTADGNAQTYL